MSSVQAERYSTVAIVLHWLIALATLSMIPLGLWMTSAIGEPGQQQTAYQAFQLHKSIGFTVLVLTLVRLAWRLGHPSPALPAAMPGWERFAAQATHAAFYGLLLLLPLTGWIYVSAGWSVDYDRAMAVATSWFGLLPIPHLPAIAKAAAATRRDVAIHSIGAHAWLAWGTLILAGAHIAAALKHQFRDKDTVLAGMVPWLNVDRSEPKAPHGGAAPLAAGTLLVIVVAAAGALSLWPDRPLPAAPAGGATAAAAPVVDGPITPGRASAWTVDRAASSITFAGAHAGKAFKGRFEDWDAHIWFDPADLAGSKAVVVVSTASAKTGDATQEGSLSEDEWLDPARFPTARFEAVEFHALGGSHYEAKGTLRIKTLAVPVTLPFELSIEGGAAKMNGRIALDRTALNLGMYSDPAAEWVSKSIDVTVSVGARRGG